MPWVNDTRFNTQRVDSRRGWRGMSIVLVVESEVGVEEICGKKESKSKSVFSNPVGMDKWAGPSEEISISASSPPLFLPPIPSILVVVEVEDAAFDILTCYRCHRSHNPAPIQLQRLMPQDNSSETYASARLNSQLPIQKSNAQIFLSIIPRWKLSRLQRLLKRQIKAQRMRDVCSTGLCRLQGWCRRCGH